MAVDELAMLIDGVPPEEQPELLVGEAPGLRVVGVAVRVEHVLVDPARGLPAQRVLRPDEVPEGVALPCRAEDLRGKVLDREFEVFRRGVDGRDTSSAAPGGP